MGLYSLGSRTSGVTTGVATWELRSTSTDRLRIREIGVFMGAATASTFGLGRPTAIGVTPTTPVTVLAEDSGDPAGTGTIALAWATAPTAPTGPNYIRRVSLPATVGAGIIWSWWNGPGLIVPVSSSIVLFNLATNGVADVYAVIDE
jgi:hypothetical protein